MKKLIVASDANLHQSKNNTFANCIRPKLLLRFLMLLSVSIITLSGCKKEDGGGDENGGNYFFKATVGGKEINYYSVNFQGGGNEGRWEHIVVGGFESSLIKNTNPEPASLDFEIWKQGGNIGPGTYSTPGEKGMIAR